MWDTVIRIDLWILNDETSCLEDVLKHKKLVLAFLK